MTERERKNVDGCAIFYRKSKFTLMECQNLEFNQLCISKPEFRKTDDMYNRVMTKDNVAIIMRLESKEPIDSKTGEKGTVLVGNVHIHWDPMHKDVKLVQSAILVEEMEKQFRKHPKASVVLCGDFNSMPGSGVYDFLTHGQLGK
jgi:CCR4-NOT transcription complex subunit 6